MATNGIVRVGSSATGTIKYKTRRNNLASQKAGEARDVAQVQIGKTYNLQMLADEIDKRNGLANRATIIYVLQEMADVLRTVLVNGDAADLGGLVTLKPSIRGTMLADGTFTEDTNTLAVTATVGPVLKDATLAATTEKIGGAASPEIESVKNTVTFEDGVLFGLTTATVKGKNLGYDALASDEGLFVDAAGVGVEVIAATATEINFRLTGEVETETTAVLSFKTRGGDKNLTDPTVVTRTVTLKPAE